MHLFPMFCFLRSVTHKPQVVHGLQDIFSILFGFMNFLRQIELEMKGHHRLSTTKKYLYSIFVVRCNGNTHLRGRLQKVFIFDFFSALNR